ncbi:MAG: CoA-binding protein, partial [Deltaproteobacteria bacterium]
EIDLNSSKSTVISEHFKQLDPIFRPKSIAVVGASPAVANMGKEFLEGLEDIGFSGNLYAVNPGLKSFAHYPTYPTVQEIPRPVDHVIISVPAPVVPRIIEDCVAKKVRSIAIFTSGFSESGRDEGRILEDKIREIISDNSTRVIGPNCMGLYCPSSGLAFYAHSPKKKGELAFISQSGGLAINFIELMDRKKVGFSKAVSYGNECDLQSLDFFQYLADDPDTKIIAAYLEGVKDGPRFIRVLKEAARKKPIILLKGGTTEEGVRAVTSHTGALAGSLAIWEAVFKQIGVIQVKGVEELVDTVLAFAYLPPPRGHNLGLISASGGLSVLYTDACIKKGFKVPILSDEVRTDLEKIIQKVGTSAKNPLDLAATFFYSELIGQIIKLVDTDRNVDALLLQISLEYIISELEKYPEYGEIFNQAIINAKKAVRKPFLVVLPYSIDDTKRAQFEEVLMASGIPVYPSVERAATALNNLIRYRETKESVN